MRQPARSSRRTEWLTPAATYQRSLTAQTCLTHAGRNLGERSSTVQADVDPESLVHVGALPQRSLLHGSLEAEPESEAGALRFPR